MIERTIVKIKVEYSAMLDIKGCTNGEEIEVSDSITVEDLLLQLGIKKHHIRFIIASINKKTVKHNYCLKENDTIFFLILAGGG